MGTGDTTRLEVDFRPLGRGETLRVALMLPLAVHGVANANYLEFYQGFLLGLDSVKRAGYSVHVDLFNTERNAETVRRIVEEDEAFRNADLVVGPVYEQPLEPVVRFAELRGIPVVSPLANITGIDSDVLFQMAPSPERKYDKAADLTDGSKQITLIYSDRTDREFEAEIRSLIGDREYRKHHYVYEHASVVERRGRATARATSRRCCKTRRTTSSSSWRTTNSTWTASSRRSLRPIRASSRAGAHRPVSSCWATPVGTGTTI